MALAIDPRRVWKFVLKADRELPTDQQTRFHLQALNPTQLADVNDLGFAYQMKNGKPGEEFRATPAAQVLATLRGGLYNWDNFKDSKGQIVDAPGSPDERIARIGEEDRVELAMEIRFGGNVTTEEGNS